MPARADEFHESEDRLQHYGMRISKNVHLPDGPVAHLVGSRTYFSWKGLVFLSQHVVIRSLDDATIADSQELFDAGFRYARKVNRVPLMRGMQFGYMVVPCLLVDNPEESLIDYALEQPRKHWALFEFPVVIDRGTGEAYYYRNTALWGAFFFNDLRHVVEQCLVGAFDPPMA